MRRLCEWLQKQTFLNVFQKRGFGFCAVLKRAYIISILQTSTFWTKSTKVVKKTGNQKSTTE